MKTQYSTQQDQQSYDNTRAGTEQTSDRKAALRGMSYDEQVASLRPDGPQAKPPDKDPNEVVGAKDTPGVLYSNTSKTNLNKASDWHKRLDFSLGRHYQAAVTFDDLVLAGRDLKAPTGVDAGPVKVPAGSNTKDPRELDYIRTDTGAVEEQGSHTFAIRGGAGGVGGPVKLQFANNGGLNLARLARSAYELVTAKGATIRGNLIDYKGQTFALGCTVQMGNALDTSNPRAYGFVGEFDMKWMTEKVSSTLETLLSAYVVAGGDVQTGRNAPSNARQKPMHPDYVSAHSYQTKYRTKSPAGPTMIRPNTAAIDSNKFNHAKVKSWGQGANQKAWLKDPVEIAAAAQQRLRGTWAPGGDWRGHPTYMKACPDFTAELVALFQTAQGSYDKPVKEIDAMMQHICAALLTVDMKHELITDPALQARVVKANRGMIARAFQQAKDIQTELDEVHLPQSTPVYKGMDEPVKGDEESGEGLIGLRAYTP